ncbi:MAG TPA: hypothetical protein DE060_16145 [Lentisphaeria bacterium]|nr:hypothetical protein [Lentisphaeria bacterium]HCG50720.1 hypothetical protein [Lentisphaeria bacterium]
MKQVLRLIIMFLPLLTFGDIQISDNGQPLAGIVTEAGIGPKGMFAAKELQHWVKVISGAELPINSMVSNLPTKIVLKVDPALKLAGDGFDISEGKKSGELIIAAPRDRGLLTAVYRLLYRNTDIIWARPNTEFGTVYSKQPTLTFQDINIRFSPYFTTRGFLRAKQHDNDWRARNGQDLFDEDFNTLSGYHNIIRIYMPEKKYWVSRPDFYPLIHGKRKKPSSGGNELTSLCFMNPDCQKEFQKNFLEYVEKHLQYERIGVCAEDNMDACECSLCMKPIRLADGHLLTPKAKNFRSTQFFMWLNPAARELKNRYPNKTIKTFAYFLTEEAPACKVESNITVSFAPIFKDSKRSLIHPYNKKTYDNFLAWVKTGAQIAWREYYGLSGEFPRPTDAVAYADWQYIRKNHGISRTYSEMYSDSQPTIGSWDQNSMYFWVLSNAALDPDRPLEEWRNEFLTRVYGEAGDDVGEYYRMIEKLWLATPGRSMWTDNDFASWRKCFIVDPQLKNKCRQLFSRALTRKMPDNGRIMLQRLAASFEKMASREPYTLSGAYTPVPPPFDPTFATGPWKDTWLYTEFVPALTIMGMKVRTELKILHDDKNIYAGIRCWNIGGKPPYAPEAGTYHDEWPSADKIEMLIPDTGKRRIQVVVDSNGNIYDARSDVKAWNGFKNIPVAHDNESWSVLVTFPLSKFGYSRMPEKINFACLRYYIDPVGRRNRNIKLFDSKILPREYTSYPELRLVPAK